MKLAKNALRIPAAIATISLLLEAFSFAIDIIPNLKSHFGELDDTMRYGGVVLLMGSLVFAIVKIGEALELVEQISKRHFILDGMARYGASGVALANLLSQAEDGEKRFPHAVAGGATLSELILEKYSLAAESFLDLLQKKQIEVSLPEESVINTFLRNLVNKLPEGSVWLGTSRLQEASAWHQATGEPSFLKFENRLEERVRGKEIVCFRSICFEDDSRLGTMGPEIEKQRKAGIKISTCINKRRPQDLTVIWIPTANKRLSTKEQSPENPWIELEKEKSGYVALCGLCFDIRGDRETSQLRIIPPNGQVFDGLKQDFLATWNSESRPVNAIGLV